LPDNSAKLEINSTTQGFLMPRMTLSQRDAINNPATGLLVFQTDNTQGFYYYTGTAWINLNSVNSTVVNNFNSLLYTTNGF
jgi:hypothetical protein